MVKDTSQWEESSQTSNSTEPMNIEKDTEWISFDPLNNEWTIHFIPPSSSMVKGILVNTKFPDPILKEEWNDISKTIETAGHTWEVDLSNFSDMEQLSNNIRILFNKKRCNKKEKHWKSLEENVLPTGALEWCVKS